MTEPGNDLLSMYRETVPELYSYISRRCGGDRELAEDVTQETYLRALRAWPSSGPPDQPLAWLRTVARNLIVSHYRGRRPDTIDPLAFDQLLDGVSPPAPAAAEFIQFGLARINARSARLLEAFHFDRKSVSCIATETGLTERAVEGRLHRARRALRRRLAPLVSDTGGAA